MSPTARSLKYLRDLGYTAEVVEKWVPVVKIRKDYLGIIDILAFKPGQTRMLGIQATSGSNVSARMRKAEENENFQNWLSCGHEFWVWGWSKVGKFWQARGEVACPAAYRSFRWYTHHNLGKGQDAIREALDR